VTKYAPRIFSPISFDSGTARTPGSQRLAAVAPELGLETATWGGLFEVEPGERAGIHHHGEQQTIAYVLSSPMGCPGQKSRSRSSRRFHPCASLRAARKKINPSNSEPFRWVVARITSTPIVVNLPDNS
jgi:hypothetical protein